ncbi:permease [gut metagenome]|uniref:Permease n=1 Tax=gut metagenome TaxID=749906 RepID=J9G506_9ZZZZ
MLGIKKLDRYILQKFLLIFVGAFFICQFVFMMQFTWRYVDELIGKGLSMEILAQVLLVHGTDFGAAGTSLGDSFSFTHYIW